MSDEEIRNLERQFESECDPKRAKKIRKIADELADAREKYERADDQFYEAQRARNELEKTGGSAEEYRDADTRALDADKRRKELAEKHAKLRKRLKGKEKEALDRLNQKIKGPRNTPLGKAAEEISKGDLHKRDTLGRSFSRQFRDFRGRFSEAIKRAYKFLARQRGPVGRTAFHLIRMLGGVGRALGIGSVGAALLALLAILIVGLALYAVLQGSPQGSPQATEWPDCDCEDNSYQIFPAYLRDCERDERRLREIAAGCGNDLACIRRKLEITVSADGKRLQYGVNFCHGVAHGPRAWPLLGGPVDPPR